jgi:hypothetical protein
MIATPTRHIPETAAVERSEPVSARAAVRRSLAAVDSALAFPRTSVRVRESNPNHHLWNNNGTWYVHYTVHPTPLTKSRVRMSLETKCLEVARQRRDEILGRAGACL